MHTQTATSKILPAPISKTLPFDGLSRWSKIAPHSPIGREKFRQLSLALKAPQPIRLSVRCTAYSNKELHRFFADPLGYTTVAAVACVAEPMALNKPSRKAERSAA